MSTAVAPEKATTELQPVPLAGAMDIPLELIVPSKTAPASFLVMKLSPGNAAGNYQAGLERP